MSAEYEAVTVRAATRDDLPFVRVLAARLVAFEGLTTRDPAAVLASSERTLEEAVEQTVQGSPTVAVLVAEAAGGARLGCVQVQRGAEYFSGDAEAYVGVLAVAEDAEGRGVGRVLMEGAEAWARERGLRRLALEVFANNGGARAFYERLGFAEDSLRVVKRL
jgi:ribosomal protein S18 acetylase RimI-like enzyme